MCCMYITSAQNLYLNHLFLFLRWKIDRVVLQRYGSFVHQASAAVTWLKSENYKKPIVLNCTIYIFLHFFFFFILVNLMSGIANFLLSPVNVHSSCKHHFVPLRHSRATYSIPYTLLYLVRKIILTKQATSDKKVIDYLCMDWLHKSV